MDLQLHIPDSVSRSIRLPEESMAHELLKELALSLYGRGLLSFGKARELAGLGKYEFGQLLGERHVPRHYSREDLEEDLM